MLADALALKDSNGQLDFERVTFRYSGGKQDAVKDFNLRIEPGKSYALGRRKRSWQEHHPFPHPASLRSDDR